jgi:hypothetical protein
MMRDDYDVARMVAAMEKWGEVVSTAGIARR